MTSCVTKADGERQGKQPGLTELMEAGDMTAGMVDKDKGGLPVNTTLECGLDGEMKEEVMKLISGNIKGLEKVDFMKPETKDKEITIRISPKDQSYTYGQWIDITIKVGNKAESGFYTLKVETEKYWQLVKSLFLDHGGDKP